MRKTMSQANDPSPEAAAVRRRLDDAERLLAAGDIDPALRRDLLELTHKLRHSLDAGAAPTAETAHLADSAAHLAESLHRRHEEGILGRARDRLQEAVLAAEAKVPLLAGLAHRLTETLANLGI
jgi:hypothetical protein